MVINNAGGQAFQQNPKLEFVSILLTSFVQNQYYRSSDDGIDKLKELLNSVDPMFAAKAAVYARNEFGMRSVSHVVAGEIANRVKGEAWTKYFFENVIRRPDDMTEILSYYYSLGHQTEPNALKRGFAQAFGHFNAYNLAKYRGEGKDVSLVDVANLVHPVHTEAVQQLIKGTLRASDTWETGLVQAGQKAKTEAEKDKLKADTWIKLLKEDKLPAFALLRNLRNIIEQAPEVLDIALKQLQNEQAIKKSLILPFRYFSAYKEIAEIDGGAGPEARKTLAAIGNALDISINNMPAFDNALVVVDHSGSMDSSMSERSKATNFEIGALFGVAMAKKSNADFMYFGDTAKYYNVTQDSVLGQLRWLADCNDGYGSNTPTSVGHGTNFHAIFETASRAYDHIFIFSDMQAWIGYYTPKAQFEDYKKRTGANPYIYAFDLSGYGTMQFPENQVYQIAGFSDKIFDVLKLLNTDKNALVNKIEKIDLYESTKPKDKTKTAKTHRRIR
jgi:hypothetical protein